MRNRDFWSEHRVTGMLLGLALPIGAIGVVAGALGAGADYRTGDLHPGAPLEQQFTIIANLVSPALSVSGFSRLLIGVVAPIWALLGFTLLTQLLRDAGDRVLSSLGVMCYAVATVFVVFVEVTNITGGPYQSAFATLYVVLAFAVQVPYGVALLRTGLLPKWIGWLTIAYNVGWFAAFYVVNYPYGPGYYPLWHLVMPFLIGVALALPGHLRMPLARPRRSAPPTPG